MQVVKHDAKPAVTQIVTVSPGSPETFDLIGLSETDMALLLLVLGCRDHTSEVPSELYDTIESALGAGNPTEGLDRIVMKTSKPNELYSYRVSLASVQAVLDRRIRR